MRYAIRSDYRDAGVAALAERPGRPALGPDASGTAMRLFYPSLPLPQPLTRGHAVFDGVFWRREPPSSPAPVPLMDWQQDAPLITAGISKAAGAGRALPALVELSGVVRCHRRGAGDGGGHPIKLRRGKRLAPVDQSRRGSCGRGERRGTGEKALELLGGWPMVNVRCTVRLPEACGRHARPLQAMVFRRGSEDTRRPDFDELSTLALCPLGLAHAGALITA